MFNVPVIKHVDVGHRIIGFCQPLFGVRNAITINLAQYWLGMLCARHK